MRLAIIDCGTNTFNLLVIELSKEKTYRRIYNTRIPVKLGEGAINQGFIAEEPFHRGIDAIRSFKQHIQQHNAESVLAFATSAIRDASNGLELVQQVKEQLGIEIQVIDGDREAELIYYGIREAVKLNGRVSLIMDIGGGSTEFILANNEQVFWKQSFTLGAARLLERFRPSDPVAESEVNSMMHYLQEQLLPLQQAIKHFPAAELVGSSGAFDSLVEMINGELNGEPLSEGKTEYDVDLSKYNRISALIRRSTLGERRNIKGLVPMRLDTIVISCLMVDFVLHTFKLNRFRVSTYSLKEGAVMDFISKQQPNNS